MNTRIESICIYAYATDDEGSSHYCDESEAIPDGWIVYLRAPSDAVGCFDIPDEWEFDTEDDAIAWAAQLALKHGAPVQHY